MIDLLDDNFLTEEKEPVLVHLVETIYDLEN